MNVFEMKQACLARVEEAFQQAEKHYNTSIPRVPVNFSRKQSRTAGTAHFTKNWLTGKTTGTEIRLSLQLLQLNGQEFIDRTPGHEAAHIIEIYLFGQGGHGRRWKEVMRVIGQSAERCHDMEVPTHNRVAASCGCQTHWITKQRAGKMRRGHGYKCNSCRQPLVLGKEITPAVAVAASKPAPKAKPAPSPRKVAKKLAKGPSKAEQVRDIIRANPFMGIDQLMRLVAINVDIPKGNIKKYVTENVKRVRG
jgi:predicted SprT family Zn-dependent metalloprotease